MQERDEALDFIYKGWREGRQQRRDVMNQRGADRIAARRQRMAGYGSPSMQMQTQNIRGPPSQSNVASSPPSSEPYVSPVQQYLEREGLHQPQEQTSSTTTGNFTDDISTPDDESTPQNEAIQEAAGSPPGMVSNSPMPFETAMANLDMAMGGTGATQSRYDPTSSKPTQANVQASPDEAFSRPAEQPVEQPVQEPTTDISEALDIMDGKIPYNLDGERVPERPKPKGMKETPYKAPYERPKDSRKNISEYGEPPKRPYEKLEMPYMKPSVEGYKKTPITRLKPDGGSGEAVPEKTAKLTPVKQLKPVEQQHKEAFEPAYEEMKNEATQPKTPKELVSQHVENRKTKKLEELGQRAANRANDESLTDNQQDAAKLRQQIIAAMKEGKSKEELQEMVQGSNLVGGDININGEKVQLDEDGNYASPDGSIKITGNKKKTKTPKPDKTVAEAAKKTIKPAKKKATDKGKENVKGRADTLAAFGMGFKNDQPEA